MTYEDIHAYNDVEWQLSRYRTTCSEPAIPEGYQETAAAYYSPQNGPSHGTPMAEDCVGR